MVQELNQSQGFSPILQQYINTLKGKTRQEFLNQISSLQPKDLQHLEGTLQQYFDEQDEKESINSMGKNRYMDLTGMNEAQYNVKMAMGGSYNPNMYQSDSDYFANGGKIHINMPYFQDGGEIGAEYGSPSYLEQVYQNQQQVNQPTVSPYGVVMTPEMLAGAGFDPRAIVPNQNVQSNQPLPIGTNPINTAPIAYTNQISSEIFHRDGTVNDKTVNKIESNNIKDAKKILENSDAVKKIQEELINRGANIKADGIFGVKTKAAVEEYQRKSGIKVDGVVGNQTKSSLGVFDIPKTYKANVVEVAQKANKVGILAKVPENKGKVWTENNNTNYNIAPITRESTKLDNFIPRDGIIKATTSGLDFSSNKQKQYTSAADFGTRGFYDLSKDNQEMVRQVGNDVMLLVAPIGEVLGMSKIALKGLNPNVLSKLSKYGTQVAEYASKFKPTELKAIKQGLSESQYVEKMIELSKNVGNKIKNIIPKAQTSVEKVAQEVFGNTPSLSQKLVNNVAQLAKKKKNYSIKGKGTKTTIQSYEDLIK